MDGTTALREALAELGGRVGAALAALFVAVGVGSVVAQQTLADASARLLARSELSASGLALAPSTVETPLSLGLSYGVALAGALLVALLAEYATVVTLRVVTGSDPRTAATRRVGRTVAVGFLVGAVVRTLVVVGLVALVLPGVFLAVSLLFAHAAVAVNDAGPVAALRRAWALAAGRRTALLGLVSLLAVLYLTPRLVGSLVPGRLGFLVVGASAGLATLLSAGVVGRAYVAAEREADSDDETTATDATDPYDAPLGADDLPEPE